MYKAKSRSSVLALGLVALGIAVAAVPARPVLADDLPMVGGAAMYPTKNIIENAVNSKDHTTLVAAVKAAGLAETLSGKGPFMVFAPTNAAFAKLPAGTVDTLLKPENKAKLVKILTSHVVGAAVMSDAIAKMVAFISACSSRVISPLANRSFSMSSASLAGCDP